MELKHIKELMTVMGRTGTKRLELKQNEFELILERQDNGQIRLIDQSLIESEEQLKPQYLQNRTDHALSRGAEMPTSRYPSAPAEAPKPDVNNIYVTSPMVGTFYQSPSPDDPTFVKVGDRIDKNTVVCIIEAMKVMNEIKANVTGVVAEVLVESGQPVEFGTKLFRIVE
ncbi:acetyl-CoA carboxylase biotin carboxyl carrier protein [Candidatus Protochlamydia naegleriophila]|uniref:Biotin carboxyl carrier protein of acetyl-CoA carboxylase n=1 Tax=Candidatus Protochlamydia naegleriophila TaxID=389348 RepID=A0A0U5JDW0_9BACT|nr:acetyl-CoA carboxylase biotin carboxyl carrier protein [Candidatus Protochlamydia naegleriophila]CUI16964.1 acetyl-CoA carboxylase biotin carboxyl carrier protein [Candidatus Protochlamydia naegleriophila]